uniref:Retroviral polymerase SH3-like domain-containing protein n=1 Tax=Lactuca sativa TaxID=4236 RepID=A0A9R1W8U8_LACSA|nr:hypothetical protein LSAT_V11C300121810 [Lactuca sativa]
MEDLRFMDFDMLYIINKGPVAVMYQSSNIGASKLKGKFVPGYNKEEKRVLNLDVKERVAIRNLLSYFIYHLVQKCSISQEMMITLSSAFEKETSSVDEDDYSMSHESHDKVLSEHTINENSCSITKTRTLKPKCQSSSDSVVEKKSKSNVKGKNYGIKVCYRCGNASHKVIHFNKREGKVVDQMNDNILTANRHNEIYVLYMFSSGNSLRRRFFSRAQSHINWLWNKRLSHLNFKNISMISGHKLKLRNISLEDFYSNSGISQNFFAVRTRQQNGISKRRNRTLIKAGRTMVFEAALPLSFWAKAVNTSCYTHNWSIIVKHHGKTAYELLKGRKPYISYFHVFGCVCYILNQKDQHSKFEAKANEGVFLGYSSVSKAFRVFNISRKTIEETTHVTFEEDSIIFDRISHPSSILNELTFIPSDPIPDLLPNDTKPGVPNVDQIINSQPIFEDQNVLSEEAEPSNLEDSSQSNTNESFNTRILRDHPKSEIIGDGNSGILSHSRVINNF